MPSREETETVISWTAADEQATVYRLMPRIVRLCRRAGGEEIRQEEGVRDGRKEAWTFLVDPACISIRPRRKATEAQREAGKAARMARKPRNAPVAASADNSHDPEAGR